MNKLENAIEINSGIYVSTPLVIRLLMKEFCSKRVGHIKEDEKLVLHLDDQQFYIHGCEKGYCMDDNEDYEKKVNLNEHDYQILRGLHNLMCEDNEFYRDQHESKGKSAWAKQR